MSLVARALELAGRLDRVAAWLDRRLEAATVETSLPRADLLISCPHCRTAIRLKIDGLERRR